MNKNEQSAIKSYVFSNITLFAMTLILSLVGIIFLADTIPAWLRIVMAILLFAPMLIFPFTMGKTAGEKLYRKLSKNSLVDIHAQEATIIPYYKGIFHVVAFLGGIILLSLLTVLFQNAVLHLITSLFCMPCTVFFTTVGIIKQATLPWTLIVIYIPYALLIGGSFIAGYVIKIRKLRAQQRDIEGELRMFNN